MSVTVQAYARFGDKRTTRHKTNWFASFRAHTREGDRIHVEGEGWITVEWLLYGPWTDADPWKVIRVTRESDGVELYPAPPALGGEG